MAERPILFSGPMVRAILDGSKVQTRRVVKAPKHARGIQLVARAPEPHMAAFHGTYWEGGTLMYKEFKCPYGVPGDRLWVRETHGLVWPHEFWAPPSECSVEYRADLPSGCTDRPGRWPIECKDDPKCPKWRPSIFMKREHSRITLEVTDVRVERVQDISDSDALDEGTASAPGTYDGAQAEVFADLWDSINAKRPGCSWEDNPFCWAVTFKLLEIANSGGERG